LKKAFGGVFIANQGFTAETAAQEIVSDRADAVAWGKLFIANPDLPERLRTGAALNAPDASTFYVAPGGDRTRGYTDYATLS